MFQSLSNFLTPNTIANFLKNNTDLKKIGINFINSEQGKKFIVETLGYDYNSFKEVLFTAFASIKKSDYGIKKQQEIQYSKKIEIYKNLANQLIKEDGLPIYGAVIMSAGFVGIDKQKVVDFLKQKGYSASIERIENYYSKNENFLKGLMKKHNHIVPGWNDQIQSSDLELDKNIKKQNLSPIPETNLEQDLGKQSLNKLQED